MLSTIRSFKIMLASILYLCLSLACIETNAQTSSTIDLQVSWKQVTERENGLAMATTEIGGYEINYKRTASTDSYQVVKVTGPATSYTLKGLPKASYDVLVAAFDTKGLYSSFVPAGYTLPNPPKAPTDLKVVVISSSSASASPGTAQR